jgi:hypothetical protein
VSVRTPNRLDDVIQVLGIVGHLLVERFGSTGSHPVALQLREPLHRPGSWAGEMFARTDIPIADLGRVFRAGPGRIELAVEPVWRFKDNTRRVRCICALALMPTQLLVGHGMRRSGLHGWQLKQICAAHGLHVDRGQVQRAIRENPDVFHLGKGPLELVTLKAEEPGGPVLEQPSLEWCREAVAQVLPLQSAPAR